MSEAGDPPVRERRPYRGVTPAERDAARRELLLDAALEQFGAQGWQATSVEGLCRAAGVTKRNFYEIYGNREDLFVDLYERLTERIREEVVAATVAAEPSLEARIRAALTASMRAMADDPRVSRVVLREVFGVSPRVEEHRRAALEATAAMALALLRETGGGPDLDDVRLELRTVGLVGAMFELLVFHEAQGGDGVPFDTVVEEVVALFLRVLA